ncbi:hypothetical protein KFK09_014550 [Dendrobium nobile]|uniref:Uncharacterized protein n=1 Tax=Dendrobium nobile TaxID=94219 RepID=A0A8T3B8C1_DENNO|nr:hypothetical protein KFK09_014550 [Dendrobium nobile]
MLGAIHLRDSLKIWKSSLTLEILVYTLACKNFLQTNSREKCAHGRYMILCEKFIKKKNIIGLKSVENYFIGKSN